MHVRLSQTGSQDGALCAVLRNLSDVQPEHRRDGSYDMHVKQCGKPNKWYVISEWTERGGLLYEAIKDTAKFRVVPQAYVNWGIRSLHTSHGMRIPAHMALVLVEGLLQEAGYVKVDEEPK